MNDDILSSMVFANTMHSARRQTRSILVNGASSKEPYFNHLLRVWHKVSEFTDRVEPQIAALLHDVVEDTEVTLDDITSRFGTEVASYVSQLTLPATLVRGDHFNKRHIQMMAMMNTTSDDVRLIKVADKLDNVSSSSVWATHVRVGYAISAEYVVQAADDFSTNPIIHDICNEFYKVLEPIKKLDMYQDICATDTQQWDYWVRGRIDNG